MKGELTFRFITPGGDEVLPVAGYFSLGDAESVNRNIDGEFEIYQNPKRRKQHAVVATGEGVVNVGRTFGAEHAGTQPCRYVVAVVDHERGTAQLADVLGGRIVRLEPRLPGLPYEAKQEYGELDMSERASVLDHKKRLVAAFGSTRRARNMNRAEATKQASQHVRGADALLETVAQLGEAALQQGATMAQVEARLAQQRNLPPHHPDATSPRQAYRMSELVPESLRSQLYHADLQAAAASASQLQQLRRDGLVTAYVLGRISTLAPDSTAPPTDDRAVALAAVDALSWLYLRSPSRITARDGRAPDGGNLRQHLGQGLLQALLTLFYTTTHEGSSTVYERTTKQKELLLRWLLALTLLAEPITSLEPDGVSALANQLHMPPTELVKRFRELGCVCSVAGGRGDAQASFSVKLLPDGSRGKPLSSFLQRIVRPAVRGRG